MQTEAQHQLSSNSPPESPTTHLDFQRMFPDEAACLRYLEKMRWPKGFVCDACAVAGDPFRIATYPRKLKCRACYHLTTVTADTVMHRSKTKVHVWFWAAYLVAAQTPGVSALELKKRLGIKRYETAFQILHKLRAAMVRPSRDKIGAEWPLEMDIVFVGGKHRSGTQGKTDKKPVIIAVEIRRREVRDPKTEKITERSLAGRVRIQCLPNKSAASVDKFVRDCIAPGAVIVSDDGNEFTNLLGLGYDHRPVPMRGDRALMDSTLPMVSRVTANLKTWIAGTFHSVRQKHLQAYLNEYVFRFNRRFHRSLSFCSLLGLGTLQAGPTYKEVYGVVSRKKSINS